MAYYYCRLALMFTLHLLDIDVRLTAFGPLHVSDVWEGVGEGMPPVRNTVQGSPLSCPRSMLLR